MAQKFCRCGFNFNLKNEKTKKKSKLLKRSRQKLRDDVHQPDRFDGKQYEKRRTLKKIKSCQELREERAQLRAIKKEQLETVHHR